MSKDSDTFDANPDAVVVLDSAGRIRNVNGSAVVMSGLIKDDLIGLHGHDFYHDKYIDKEDCEFCKHIKDETKSSVEIKLNTNPIQWIEVTLSPIASSEELYGMVDGSRYYARKKTEDELIKSEDEIIARTSELNSTLTSMQDVVYKTDTSGCVLWVTISFSDKTIDIVDIDCYLKT